MLSDKIIVLALLQVAPFLYNWPLNITECTRDLKMFTLVSDFNFEQKNLTKNLHALLLLKIVRKIRCFPRQIPKLSDTLGIMSAKCVKHFDPRNSSKDFLRRIWIFLNSSFSRYLKFLNCWKNDILNEFEGPNVWQTHHYHYALIPIRK